MQVYGDVASTILAWHDFAKESTYRHTLIGILPSFICWHIWNERCNRRFSDRQCSWWKVTTMIITECILMLARKSFRSMGGHSNIIQCVGFRVPTILEKRCMIVR